LILDRPGPRALPLAMMGPNEFLAITAQSLA
jgi:hypothetical protein